jgi:xanthine dehydrogenase accessory factor
MKDFRAIVDEYRKVDFARRRAALATVIQVRGSSYRSPGARMLITDDGRWVGSISGGCLEGDALRKARQVMNDNRATVVTYDTREESNQNLGIGLGCNGVIDVLIEPVAPDTVAEAAFEKPQAPLDAPNPIQLFESFLNAPEPLALATIHAPAGRAGEKLLINSAGTVHFGSIDHFPEGAVEDLKNVFETHRSESRIYDGEVGLFLELIQPLITVILFGGGFDARPVSLLAKSLGWNVEVTDECVAHIAPVFFPGADKLSLCQRDFVDRDFAITPYTACVLMSHNYTYDRDVLKKLLNTGTPYIGILGPRKRFDQMREEFSEQGIKLTTEQLRKIHSPIGLDIGAEAPDEIAVSIIAEIQSVFANRSGGFLKYRSGPIHHRDLATDQVFKQVYVAPGEKGKATGA